MCARLETLAWGPASALPRPAAAARAFIPVVRDPTRSCRARATQGESARMASFVGAIAIADLVKSTLGPKGMDKILQSVSGAHFFGRWALR